MKWNGVIADWNNKGGMKTYENTKMRDQKMMLENRNTPPNNSPRNSTGGPPSGPSTPHVCLYIIIICLYI